MCWWCSWWSARGCQGFHKEAWWEWDQVHKTWQMHCWLFLRQIHQWQTQKLARDFQRKRYQGKQLGLEEENCLWWCRFSRWSNQCVSFSVNTLYNHLAFSVCCLWEQSQNACSSWHNTAIIWLFQFGSFVNSHRTHAPVNTVSAIICFSQLGASGNSHRTHIPVDNIVCNHLAFSAWCLWKQS